MKLVRQDQPGLILQTGMKMVIKIRLVARKKLRFAADNQHVFRVIVSRGITEIKAAGSDGAAVNQHDFIVRNQVAIVNISRNTGGIKGLQCRAYFSLPAARSIIPAFNMRTIQNNANRHAPSFRGDKRAYQRPAGKAVGLHLNGMTGGINQGYKFTGGAAVRGKVNAHRSVR